LHSYKHSYHFLKVLAYCILFFCVLPKVQAQRRFNSNVGVNKNIDANKKDSTSKLNRKHEHIDNHVDIFFTDFKSNQKKYVDTSILLFHRDRYLNNWQQNIGNSGSVVYDIKPIFNTSPTRQLGFQSIMKPYLFIADNARFINTTKPYTEFWYKAGGQKEQGGELFHTQNFTPENNFSFRYAKYGAPGYFTNQKTNHDHLAITFQYKPSKNKRYSTKLFFGINQIKQDENGGIVSDTVLPYANYALRTLIPVVYESAFGAKGSNVVNYFRHNELQMQNYFIVGFKKAKDSTTANKPGFQIVHTLKIIGEKQVFKNKNPLLKNYTKLDTILFKTTDSVYTNHSIGTIQNEIGGQLPNIAGGKILLNASIGFELQTFQKINSTNTYYNNYVKANIQSNQEKLKWQYAANAQFYFVGNAAGNYVIDAFASRKIKNNIIEVNATQSLNNPAWISTDYASNFYNWQNGFGKIFNTTIGAKITNEAKCFQIAVNNATVVNYVYWDTNLAAQQLKNPLSLLQLDGSKDMHWRKFSWLQELLIQKATSNTPINFPAFAARTKIAYTNYIFNKSMLASMGIDACYNTPYSAASYQPLIAQFANASAYQQNNVPRIGVFFNSKIKRFRVYISADELLQATSNYNRILMQGYPATDWILRAGFSWVMVN
jgi:hypothetical protein